MTRETTYTDAVPFVAQRSTLDLDMGREIDWDNVTLEEIPAGTAMVELASGKVCPWSDKPATETSIGLLHASANMNDRTPNQKGIIIGGNIFENLLPDFGGGDWADIKAEFEGGTFHWQTYGDSRTA